jgi:hypothetical protein
MGSSDRGSGVVEAVEGLAPALTGNPAAVWQAARQGTQAAASALPDAPGLDRLKDFVRRHPVLSTCVVLAVAYYLFGRGRR